MGNLTKVLFLQRIITNIGMSLYKDFSRYKIFLADTVLFVNNDYTENIIYEKLLSYKLDANLGYVYGKYCSTNVRG